MHRRPWIGWGALAAAALLGAAWLSRLDYARKISTDVLDLIPADEAAPELTLVRQLASQAEARTMLLELTGPDGRPAPAAAATRLAAELARDPAFDQALAIADPAARDALGREIYLQRLTLLFPRWLRERQVAYAATGRSPDGFVDWLAEDVTGALGRFLATPEALAFQEIVPADPLLLLPGVVGRLKGGLGLLAPGASSLSPALVWARLAASPLSEAGQAPAFTAIDRAAAAVGRDFPGLRVASTGVNKFAAASRARIERELRWLNTLSIVAVLAVALVFIRRVHRSLHLVPVVLLAVLGAWVCVTLVFDRVHILVFVLGSLLAGVAVDYGFYLFMQPPLRPDEDYWAKVRRLAKPLLASCLTTVAGFALLVGSELPFIRQLGVFVGAGLIGALGAAVIYFSTVSDPYLEARDFRGARRRSDGSRRTTRRLLVAAGLLALPGLALLQWRDDIRDLEIPSEGLQAEAARIHALFGDTSDRTVYLTFGRSVAEARESLQLFESWLQAAGGGRTVAVSPGALVPTAAELASAADFFRQHPEFPDRLRARLAAGGYETDGFAPFFEEYARQTTSPGPTDLAAAVESLQARLRGPASLVLHAGRPLSWFVTLATAAPAAAPPAGTHTVTASQLQSLNRIFSRYRQSALALSLTGLTIVGAGVFLAYGWRDGLRIFAIPCGAGLGVFGLFGWLGQPLNMFHLLGAFLGICLAHNYSIFTATSAYRGEPPPVSVRLSALTAAASFGVLALSGIPVVRALGLTVGLMVVTALLMIEFEHLAGLGKKP